MKIGIIGSGTASAVSLLAIFDKFKFHRCKHIDVYCIYNPDIPVTTVGESTSPIMPSLLYHAIDFSVTEELKEFDGTLRWGTRYYWEDINDKNFLVRHGHTGLHVNSEKFSGFVINKLDKLYDNFFQIHGNVSDITQDHTHVSILVDGVQHKFDYIIDCRGSPSAEEMDSGLYEFPKFETVNSVILFPDFKEYNEDLTSAYPHDDGWMFGVPLTHRKAFGYLYNKNITTQEEAIEKFSKLKNIDASKLRKFSWRQYYKKEAMNGRILSMGNRLYFLEPAQALPLHFYINLSVEFIETLIKGTNLQTPHFNRGINTSYLKSMEDMLNLVALNYVGPCKKDTPFWNTVTALAKERLQTSERFQKYVRLCQQTGEYEQYWAHNSALMKEYIEGFDIKLDQLSQI